MIDLESQNKKDEPDLEYVNQILRLLSSQTKTAFANKDYKSAQALILRVLEIAPRLSNAWMDLGTATLRLGHYEEAYGYFIKVLSLMKGNVDTNLYDGLTEVCHLLGKSEEKLKYGQLAIESKKKLIENQPKLNIPHLKPAKFNPENRAENVISYSLFGNLPRYCETAILNLKIAQEIFPEWTCRFYVDESVPEDVLERLIDGGAEIIQVNEVQKKISGLYWRFFVMDDIKVKRFLIRDADSLLSYREQAAVDEWLKSDYWFHTMRDNYSHTELILAGMWGGCSGVFHDLYTDILNFIKTGLFLTESVMDQHYLRYRVWNTIKQSLLSHDSQGYDIQAVAFPKQKKTLVHETHEYFHIGANEATFKVKISIQHEPTHQIYWMIKDQNQNQICKYKHTINGASEFELYFSSFYAEKIRNGEWTVETAPIK